MYKIALSACLLFDTKYNGENNFQKVISDFFLENQNKIVVIPFCPEQLGGFSTPRLPATIVKGDGGMVWQSETAILQNDTLEDVTDGFKKGAMITFNQMVYVQPDLIVLKDGSPSCGVNEIYNLDVENKHIFMVDGEGISANLLRKNGFTIVSEKSFINAIDKKEVITKFFKGGKYEEI